MLAFKRMEEKRKGKIRPSLHGQIITKSSAIVEVCYSQKCVYWRTVLSWLLDHTGYTKLGQPLTKDE